MKRSGQLLLPMMLSLVLAAAGFLTSGSLTSCSSGGFGGDSVAATIDPRFREVYGLGAEHGVEFARLATDSAASADRLCDRLLDVRARANNISARYTPDAGQAYLRGFETGVRRTSPALADSIF